MRIFTAMKQKETPRQEHDNDEITSRMRVYLLVRKGLIGFIFIAMLNLAFSNLFYTPKMHAIARDNNELVFKYRIMRDKIRVAERKLEEIRHRDNNVYRTLFSTDSAVIYSEPYPDSRYARFQGDDYSSLLTETWRAMDNLARDIYYESVSFDELQALAKNKETLSSAIPAIWPIDRSQLKALYSFGWRAAHPIYKVRKFHKGVDLAADKGVPVFATGDAVVEMVDRGQRRAGYGQQVLLNHDFGYKTRYAHLSRMYVEPGQKVTRGQIIGEVGMTGGSTGPHLHYEVIHMGQVVNPVNYFNRNMTVDEYQKLIEEMKDNDLEVTEQ